MVLGEVDNLSIKYEKILHTERWTNLVMENIIPKANHKHTMVENWKVVLKISVTAKPVSQNFYIFVTYIHAAHVAKAFKGTVQPFWNARWPKSPPCMHITTVHHLKISTTKLVELKKLA